MSVAGAAREPSGEITVTTGGVSVVTDDLLHVAADLDAVSASVAEALGSARSAQLEVSPARLAFIDAGPAAYLAERELAEMLLALPGLGHEIEELAVAVRTAALSYDFAETAATDMAWSLGSLALWLAARPGAALIGALPGGKVPVPPALQALFAQHGLTVPPVVSPGPGFSALATDPRFLAGVRAIADDAAARVDVLRLVLPLVGVPLTAGLLSRGAGGSAAGPVALPVAAAGVPAAGGARPAEGRGPAASAPPVAVRPSGGTTVATAPRGIADRLARIPPGAGAQVRVETYSPAAGHDVVEVFVAGTDSTAPVLGGDNPWDWQSNGVAAVGDESSDSYRATVRALEEAGVGPETPVTVTGYSQGARIAALLAASGDYNVTAVVEAGGPSGDVHLPADVTHVSLQHSDDFVPALGGNPDDPNVVVVGREALDGPASDAWDAHALERYRETAALADASTDPALVAAIEAIDRLPPGAEGTRQDYEARRG